MAPAAALSHYDQTGASPLPGLRQCSSQDAVNALHIANNNGDRTAEMSEDESYRTLGKLIAAALRKRVGNGKSVTIKQLSFALQISEQTVWNLLAGNSDPSGRVLMKLLTFFDGAFANEVLGHTGCTVAKLSDQRAEALKKISDGMELLRRLG